MIASHLQHPDFHTVASIDARWNMHEDWLTLRRASVRLGHLHKPSLLHTRLRVVMQMPSLVAACRNLR